MYGGPGDTVPTGPAAPSAPGPAEPPAAPPAPESPGPSPAAPSSPGGGAPGPAASAPRSPAGAGTATSYDWWTWWDWNREWFLDPSLELVGPVTGSPDDGVGPLTRQLIESRIVPVLEEQLGSNVDRDVRHASLLALGRTGDAETDLDPDRTLSFFERDLAHRSSWTSDNAIVALGRYGNARGASWLAKILAEEASRELGGRRASDRARAFAATGLAETALRSTNTDVRRFVLRSLAAAVRPEGGEPHLGAAAVLSLAMLAEASDDLRYACGEVLPDPWQWFLDPELDLRLRAHLPRLAAALAVTPEQRETALVRILEALDDNPRAEVEAGLVQAAGSIEVADRALAEKVTKRLKEATRDTSPAARQLAWIALGRRASLEHGELAAKTLLRATKRMRSRDEPWIALAFGVQAHGEIARGREPSADLRRVARLSLRQSRSKDLAIAWAIASGLARDEAAVDEIVDRVLDLGPGRERTALTFALGLTRAPEAIEPLRELALEASHDPDTLESVALALGLVGDGARAQLLLEGFENACCAHASTSHARALARIGDGRLVGPLAATLADDKARDLDRAWSAHALGRLARRGERTAAARFGHRLNYAALLSSQSAVDRSGAFDFR